jgi:putative membrane protein
MRITIMLILALILALIVTIFAVQNNKPEDITFLAWTVEGSLALILMITLAVGIIIGLLVSTPAWFRRVRQSAHLKKNIQGLEKDLEEARLASKPSPDQPVESSVVEAEPKDDVENEKEMKSVQEPEQDT